MIIDITKLNSNLEEFTVIDLNYSFSEEELKNTGIIKLDNVSIYGSVSKDSLNDYYIDLDIKGIMVLPCSISLKPVNYEFNIKIDDNLSVLLEEIDKNVKKIENSLDIFPIVWENILMEVPMRVVSSDIEGIPLSGDGWKFIKED